MPDNESPASEFDWRVTSFEGARREQLRRWARLPLERILLAIEEMQDIAHALGTAPRKTSIIRCTIVSPLARSYGTVAFQGLALSRWNP